MDEFDIGVVIISPSTLIARIFLFDVANTFSRRNFFIIFSKDRASNGSDGDEILLPSDNCN